MWRAFKNADPVVKAAVISGIFLLIGAIITGAFQLIKLQTGQNSLTSSPTPTLVRTALPTPRPTDPVPTAPPLPMLVQHPSLFSNDNNNDAVSFSQPVQPGNLIIVAITQWVGGIKSVTDDQNDAYNLVARAFATPHTSPDAANGVDHDYAQLYYATNVAGGTTTVTVTFTASGDTNVGIYEFSGFDRIAPLDPKEVVFQTGTSQKPNGGVLKTTIDNELCFVVGVDDDGSDKTPRPGNQYHSLADHQDDGNNNERFYTEYLIASPGNYQTDFSIVELSHWAVVGAAFKP